MFGFDLTSFIAIIVAVLIAIDVHECCHAWMAAQMGDPTARDLGRVSLNPIVHLDPLGTLMIFLTALTGFGIGWGKPVPVDPYRLRYGPRTGMGIVSLAGPLANLTTATVLAIPFRLGLGILPDLLVQFLFIVSMVNIGLAIFNLLPVPPLDGYGVLMGILSSIRAPWAHRWSYTLARYERYGPMILLLVIIANRYIPLFSWIIYPPYLLIRRLLLGV
ncbi:MAG: site-2 protease family protein [Anaerolineae bacterium]|nr:site-2 protease family protein [Anaerolineae bacterium]NIN96625.1 site-2 protease family protein [Anaerolineae bacterium]NIQ79658.1 site-2 protease family protein [Anaerolineae bacterium]